jgi:hypothetical protein
MRAKTQHHRRHSPVAWGLPILLAAGSWSHPSRAQTESIAIHYAAPEQCPTETRFANEIVARTSRARLSVEAQGLRVFRATISARNDTFVGQLDAEASDGSSAAREVISATCSEVTTALALMVAIAVDPKASTAPIAELSVAVDPPPAPAASPSARPPAPVVASNSLPAQPTPIQQPRRWSVGGGALLLGGIAPDIAPGAELFGETQSGRTQGFAPVLRVGAGYADSAWAGGAARQAAVRWMMARVEACPLSIAPSEALRLLACADLDIGALRAQGENVTHPGTKTQFFTAAGITARIRYTPARSWFVEIAGGGAIPLVRCTFVFEQPHTVVYDMPWVGWHASAGAGYHFF